jgi:hypothetical protein
MSDKIDEATRCELEICGLGINLEEEVYWPEGSPLHPRNWTLKRKIYDTGVLCIFITFSYVRTLFHSLRLD